MGLCGVPIPGPQLRAITTLPFVISTEAQRSGEISVWIFFLGNVFRTVARAQTLKGKEANREHNHQHPHG